MPRIHLAVDNCFASKRWTQPLQWARILSDLGIRCAEASADTECDPLYTTSAYRRDWIAACKAAADETGTRVVNLYSGHGTYATLGLGHWDVRNRDHIQHDWIAVMIAQAAALKASLGCYCHAFDQATLEDPAAYAAAETDLLDRLSALAALAADRGLPGIGIEQMYTPHQIPWTISGAERFLSGAMARGGSPVYLTLDTGHQIGQRKFLRPTRDAIARAMAIGRPDGLWLGAQTAYEAFARGDAGAVESAMDARPYLFAEPVDGDLYAWARRLGAYSPILHLQQTDGTQSAHRPFTPEANATGIVTGEKLLAALTDSFARAPQPHLPPPVKNVYLTIEVFSATTDLPHDILSRLAASVSYWRKFVPEDGIPLDQLPAPTP